MGREGSCELRVELIDNENVAAQRETTRSTCSRKWTRARVGRQYAFVRSPCLSSAWMDRLDAGGVCRFWFLFKGYTLVSTSF